MNMVLLVGGGMAPQIGLRRPSWQPEQALLLKWLMMNANVNNE